VGISHRSVQEKTIAGFGLPQHYDALRNVTIANDMTDYAIFISEKAFLQDPLRELHKLTDLTETEIREKLEALAFAQRVVLPDHPDSLFVPAFLRESLLAQREAVDP
jgi:hypothetical protein